jgi:hypothetical protein
MERMTYDKENRMATFTEELALKTHSHTYALDGFKKVENVGRSLSTIIWDGTDYLMGRRLESKQRTRDALTSSCFTGTRHLCETHYYYSSFSGTFALQCRNIGGGLGCL